MISTSIKIDKSTLKNLKLLKSLKGYKTYEDLINQLVINELLTTHAYNGVDFIAEKSVVTNGKKDLIITKVKDSQVFFNDGTYVLNGGKYCNNLKLVTTNIENYKGLPENE